MPNMRLSNFNQTYYHRIRDTQEARLKFEIPVHLHDTLGTIEDYL